MPKPKDKHDEQHLKNVQLYLKRIQELYKMASDEASKIGCSINGVDSSKPFNFEDYPQTKKKMDALLSKFKKSLEVSIVNGIDAEWALSNSKNDEIVNKAFGSKKDKLTDEQKKRYFNNNEDAKDAFIERKRNGLSLSDSVWDFTKRFKSEIEMGLDLGIRSGKSADQMSRSLRDYLQNTNKLFRRYRDEHGILQLSKAAKAFHPGQGVYRSSYMNARRLAATETNIAYRTADHLRWEKMDFVVGIEIHLSNNHTCKGRDGKPHDFHDICDELQGKYPKDFKFTGWHPHCRCFVTSILKTPDELKSGKPSKNEVKELPSKFKEWYESNKERIDKAKSLPYFIKDNFKDGEFIGLQNTAELPIIEINTNVTGSFVPAKSIEEAVERAMNLGIERVDFGRATLGEVNIALEAIEEEARNVKLDLKSFFIQENAHKDIFGKKAKETQKIGGYYSHNKNELHIDLGVFRESIYRKAISWEERLKRNEDKIKSNLDSIALYKSKLGKSKSFDKELKKYISDLDFQNYKFEKEVRLAKERIQAGAPPRTFTYAQKYENIKDQVKATIHHEFGHYVDNKMGGARFNSKLPGISDYSDTMSDEFFAEYYAKYQMEGKDGIPSDILKVLEEYEIKFAKEVQKPLTTLEKAKIRQDARTKEQIADIQRRWDERKKNQLIRVAASNVLNVAKDYSEVDYSKLEAVIGSGDIKKISTLTREVAKAVSDMKKQEKALSTIIPNVHEWHKKFTIDELKNVYSAVEKKLANWDGLTLSEQAKKLKFEAEEYFGTDKYGAQTKYKTWGVAQDAYRTHLYKVQYKIDKQAIEVSVTHSFSFAQNTKNAKVKQLVSELQSLLKNNATVAELQSKADSLNSEVSRLEAAKLARNLKKLSKLGNGFSPDAYTQERKDKAVWDKGSGKVADKTLIDVAAKSWIASTEDEKDRVYEYTDYYCNVNEPLQGRKYLSHQTKADFEHRVKNITSYISKNILPKDMWFMRGDDGLGVIASRIRFAGGKMPNDLQDLVGMTMQEGGFMSTSSRKGQGFSDKSVIINVYAPKGTQAAYIEPISEYGDGAGREWDGKQRFSTFSIEHETLFQRGTLMRITKVYQVGTQTFIDCEVIGQEIKPLSYVSDSDIGY